MNRKQYIDPFETPTPTTTEQNAGSRGYVDPFSETGTSELPKSKLDPYIEKVTSTIAKIPYAQETISAIAPALDILSRPSYAVNRFISEYQKPEGQLLDSTASAFVELFSTDPSKRRKLTYSDVIRQKDPEFAYNNPTLTQVIGFIGDVALDPTTYLGVGAVSKGFKVAGGTLNKGATKLLKEALPNISRKVFVAEDGTIQLIQSIPKVEKEITKLEKLSNAFEKRVAGSEVVDEAGELIPLYRGTNNPVEKVKGRQGIQGLYFTTLPEVADIYAQEAGSSVVKVYSNAKKLLDLNDAPTEDLIKVSERLGLPVDVSSTTEDIVNGIRNKFGNEPLEAQNKLIAELKKSGFQGMKFMSDDGGIPHQQYLIFSERNIIPAYTNKGLRAAIQQKEYEASLKPLGNSVVRNKYGLMRFFHGTIKDKQAFRPTGMTRPDFPDFNGIYFTNIPEEASAYARGTELVNGRIEAISPYAAAKSGSNIIPAFLNIEKPFFSYTKDTTQNSFLMKQLIDKGIPFPKDATGEELAFALADHFDSLGKNGIYEVTELIKKQGYDGLIRNKSRPYSKEINDFSEIEAVVFNDKQIYNAISGKPVAVPANIKTNPLAMRDYINKELTERGYFDAVVERQEDIQKLFDNFGGGAYTKPIAEAEVLSDLTNSLARTNKGRPLDTLWESEVTERVTDRMNKLIALNPKLVTQLIQPKGLYFKVGLPFGQQRELARIFGTEYLSKQIGVLSKFVSESERLAPKALGVLGRTFNRDFGLPEEYIKFRNDLENELGYLSEQMVRNTRKLFTGITPEGRERIGNALHWSDGETRKLEEIRKMSSDPSFRELTDGEAAQIFQQGAEKYKLNPDEFAVMTGIQQSYKEAGLLELRAGLLKYNLLNYSARGYEVIENADDMSLITRGKYGSAIPQPYLASSKQRKFLTKEEAEEAGLVPELDAAILYAHRVLQSHRALAIKSFKDSVTELFGSYDPRIKTAHTGILPTAKIEELLPKRIVDDMKMIGSSVIPSGINDTQRQLLRALDKMQGFWKRGATTSRPTFAPKQLISNTFQAAMVIGTKAFKSFDPRVAIDAAILLVRGGKPLDNLPLFLQNWFAKSMGSVPESILAGRVVLQRHFDDVLSDDLLQQFTKTTTLGQRYTGTELVQLAKEKGIIRGFDSTGESFSQKVGEALTRESTSHWRSVKELTKVWNHASFIEDYSRMMLFMNGIGMGYSPEEASKLVNKALFDYQRGLSAIEKNVIRRVLPFYSFQRFAIPFVLKQTLNRPGDIATIEKLMRTTEKLLISGEELTPAEVDIFNQKGENYLLEQPRVLAGFDKNGTATLNILNNFTPWDVLNLFTYDKEGNIDIARTAEKTFLSAMSPFLKIPATAMLKRDFFTGRTIDEMSRIQGNLDISLGRVIPDKMKELIGWETRTNIVSGKTSTYINPFLSYYSMQFVPALREYIKPLTDLDKAKGNWLTGIAHYVTTLLDPIQKVEYDFKAQEQNQLLSLSKDLNDIQEGLVKAKIKGDAVGTDTSFEFNDNLKRLQTYLKILDERNKARQDSTVRGQGLGMQQTEPTGVPTAQENNFR